jgi:hypothetical protein
VKLLVVGILAAIVSVLLTVTLLAGYRYDQHVIRWFPGTGIAGKLDVLGGAPSAVEIVNDRTGKEYAAAVAGDGTFVAPLPPGRYDVRIPGDGRAVTLDVPSGECLDLVLDYRFPVVVLKVPREGWPLPAIVI